MESMWKQENPLMLFVDCVACLDILNIRWVFGVRQKIQKIMPNKLSERSVNAKVIIKLLKIMEKMNEYIPFYHRHS